MVEYTCSCVCQLWHCREGAPFNRVLPTSSGCGTSPACFTFRAFLYPYADCPNNPAQLSCVNTNVDYPLLHLQYLRPDFRRRYERPCDIDVFTAYRGSPKWGDPKVNCHLPPGGDAGSHCRSGSPYRRERRRAYHRKPAAAVDRRAWPATRS